METVFNISPLPFNSGDNHLEADKLDNFMHSETSRSGKAYDFIFIVSLPWYDE